MQGGDGGAVVTCVAIPSPRCVGLETTGGADEATTSTSPAVTVSVVAITVREATPADQAAIEQLRYEVYVAEKGLFGDRADHRNRRLPDPDDVHARIWVAEADGEVVGTHRLLWGAEVDLAPWEENFGVGRFLDLVGPERCCVFGRFVISAEHRGGDVSLLLLAELATWALTHDIDVGFCDCEPHLVAFYEAMGFRPYRSVYNDPVFGVKVPLVIVASDRGHLASIGSFVADMVPQSFSRTPHPGVLDLVAGAVDHRSTALEAWQQAQGAPTHLFAGLDLSAIEAVTAKATRIEFSAGDVLIRAGHGSRTCWVLEVGTVEIREGGRPVAFRSAPNVVGELSMLLDVARTADVVAATPGAALVLSDRSIERLTAEDPRAAAQLFRNLAAWIGRKLVGGEHR